MNQSLRPCVSSSIPGSGSVRAGGEGSPLVSGKSRNRLWEPIVGFGVRVATGNLRAPQKSAGAPESRAPEGIGNKKIAHTAICIARLRREIDFDHPAHRLATDRLAGLVLQESFNTVRVRNLGAQGQVKSSSRWPPLPGLALKIRASTFATSPYPSRPCASRRRVLPPESERLAGRHKTRCAVLQL